MRALQASIAHPPDFRAKQRLYRTDVLLALAMKPGAPPQPIKSERRAPAGDGSAVPRDAAAGPIHCEALGRGTDRLRGKTPGPRRGAGRIDCQKKNDSGQCLLSHDATSPFVCLSGKTIGQCRHRDGTMPGGIPATPRPSVQRCRSWCRLAVQVRRVSSRHRRYSHG